MAALGAIGLAFSTLTEHAIGAIAALAIFVVASEVVDQVPQFAVDPALPADPLVADVRRPATRPHRQRHAAQGPALVRRLPVLAALFAWARFTTADVTS